MDAEAQVGVVGSKHKECSACGEVLLTEEIDALPKETTKETQTEATQAQTQAEQTQAEQTQDEMTDAPAKTGGCKSVVPAFLFVLTSIALGSVALFKKRF